MLCRPYDNRLDVDSAGLPQLLDRVTTLAATKSDVATMLWWLVDEPSDGTTTRTTTPEADNCLLLRMLSHARVHRYRIARTVLTGLYVDTKLALGQSDPETATCACNAASSAQQFCHLSLPQV